LKIPGITANQNRMLEKRGFCAPTDDENGVTFLFQSNGFGYWVTVKDALAECRRLNAREKAARYRAAHHAERNATQRKWRAGHLEHRRGYEREYMRRHRALAAVPDKGFVEWLRTPEEGE
jgi:hypothetical protein